MTREEEIQNYAYNNCIAEDIDDTSYCLIVDAIKWADETMLDRACEWLENRHNIENHLGVLTSRSEDLSKAFRQAMEGE